MKPFLSRTAHDPPKSYGDCFSACLSSLLETKVPHVLHDGCDADMQRVRIDLYLYNLGLAFVEFPCKQDDTDNALIFGGHLTRFSKMNYMLSGSTIKGGGHYVVANGKEIVHNPSPGVDIVAPFDDGVYWLGFVVKRT